jgi:hypothetical protein
MSDEQHVDIIMRAYALIDQVERRLDAEGLATARVTSEQITQALREFQPEI